MYKSARYIRTKNNTYKLLKDFNDCVDVYVMKQEAIRSVCNINNKQYKEALKLAKERI